MLNKNIKLKNYINNDYYNDLHFIFLKKLLSGFLKKGNKACALKLLNNLKYILKKNTKVDSNLLFLITLLNSLTKFHFIKKKRGGSLKEIPIPISYKRQSGFIIKNLIRLSLSKRTFNPSVNNLALLIFLTNRNKGPLIYRKYRLYKKAIDNKFLLYLIRK
jgi:ribosomal protein S7